MVVGALMGVAAGINHWLFRSITQQTPGVFVATMN
jgi:hypothetical protein